MRRFIMLLAITLVCSITSFAYDFEYNGLCYNIISENEVEVTDGKNYSGAIEVPDIATYNGINYSVVKISTFAFQDCPGLTSIRIPSSISSIATGAFRDCPGIRYISVDSDNSIYDSRNDCNAIVETKTNKLVLGCISTTIPNDICIIGEAAFAESLVEHIDLPSSVTKIEQVAFCACEKMKTVIFRGNIQDIAWNSFTYCCNLESIIPIRGSSKYSIYTTQGGLIETESSTLVVGTKYGEIPSFIKKIGKGVFGGYNLGDVEIPEGVVEIDEYAFNSANIESIKIPTTLRSVGIGAFDNFQNERMINAVHISDLVNWFKIDYPYGRHNPLSQANNLYLNDTLLEEIIIPNEITNIKIGALMGWNGQKIILHSDIKTIASEAFGCKNLNEVVCYATEPPVCHDSPFWGVNLNNCTLKVPAHSVEKYASVSPWNEFGTIEGIANTVFEVDGIYYSVLNGEEVEVVARPEDEEKYSGNITIPSVVSYAGVEYKVTTIGFQAFYGSSVEFVRMPYTLETIDVNAFADCRQLKKVYFPQSIQNIAWNSFVDCPNLEEVDFTHGYSDFKYTLNGLHDGLIEIETKTLVLGCKSGYIDHSVKKIGDGVFSGYILEHIDIPEGVTDIGYAAFYNSDIKSIRIPSTLKRVEQHAFEFRIVSPCRTEIYISDLASWLSIDFNHSEYNPLYWAKKLYLNNVLLEEVVIPNQITKINAHTMAGWSGKKLSIHSNVKSIGELAFYHCENLNEIECHATEPPVCEGEFIFSNVDDAILYVPSESLEKYREHNIWGKFKNIKALDFEIKDGTLANFEIADEVEIGSLTYTRTLPNLKWNALYVPFEIPMEEIADKYEVAYINDINSYDKNDDGAIDDMEMEIIKIKSGTLNANYPYLIKARNEEARSMSITLEDATLYPTVSTTIDCSSVFAKHEVTGIYDRKYQNELPEGCMAISVNGAWQPIATGSYLNPFRLYMTVSARDGSPVKVEPAALSRIRIRAFDEDMETGIEETENGNVKTESFILDLSGRRVRNPEKGGVYIINGKKVVY